ncbi:MAG: hypothetical protein JNK15_17485 [Planctomycetes bacterium]|nr:hypothetical protein [Planctomycetota bacterium]
MTSQPTTSPAFLTAALPGQAEFERLRRSARSGIWIEAIGLCALLLVAFALPSLLTDRLLRLEWIFRAILLVTFLVVVVRTLQRRLFRPLAVPLSDDEMALAVERSAPEVKQALISSLQFDRELQAGGEARHVESPALKAAVVADVRARLGAIPFGAAIDRTRVRRYTLDLAGAVLFFVGWAVLDAGSLGTWAARNLALANVDWPRYTTLALADGTAAGVRLPQGDALTVRVQVQGTVPDQVWVDYVFAGGERGSEAMSRTGAAEFTWTIESVLADMTLDVHGGDSLPLSVRVEIVERPRVEDLAVRVKFPDYMEREPWTLPPTEGELRLPKGALLTFTGKSQKPLTDAFLLFGNDQKVPLARGADGLTFGGDFAPVKSGLLVVDVVDTDRLGSGTPPKLVLRVGDDRAPTLEFRLRGIGTSITAHARIPGDLKVKDDFGLREVSAAFRASEDKPVDKGADPLPEAPFANAEVLYGSEFTRSALRYESTASVDLRQWNKAPTEDAATNPIRPGMLLSLRFGAKDNFGPGDPHEGFGETMTFRVVTRERLTEDLRRRQVEQRQELERILADEQRATIELGEMMGPAQAGDKRKQVEAKLKALARLQQALGRRVAFVGEAYARILLEYENNRLWEPSQVRQIEALIPVPLAELAKDSFPATSRLVDAFVNTADEAKRAEAVVGYKDIERRILAVLKSMEQAESLAALIEELRVIIRHEDSAIDATKKIVKDKEADIFSKPKQDKPGSDKPNEKK